MVINWIVAEKLEKNAVPVILVGRRGGKRRRIQNTVRDYRLER